jgi:glutamine synthetase
MLVEYVWLDANGLPRSKTKVIYEKKPDKMEDLNLPYWNYDGSSTGQASGSDSEVIIKPKSVFPDPFRGGDCIMVLCDTYTPEMKPLESNQRFYAEERFNQWPNADPLFGLEQEFFLMKGDLPLVYNNDKECKLAEQGDYYCGSGANNAIGRDCVESAFKRCILAGIHVTGMNAEVAPSQWEIQVCAKGIAAADQLVMTRYILNRTAEMYGLWVNYEPKPMKGNWNGSGCHVNFSTKKMRSNGGYSLIFEAVKKLEKEHEKHMKHYGKGNEERMTGEHETSSMETFSYGVADRGASIRIPNDTKRLGKGYFEDRRPASNMDPYLVTSLILETSLS